MADKKSLSDLGALTQQAAETPTAAVKADRNITGRDEAAARVLSIGYFTTRALSS